MRYSFLVSNNYCKIREKAFTLCLGFDRIGGKGVVFMTSKMYVKMNTRLEDLSLLDKI